MIKEEPAQNYKANKTVNIKEEKLNFTIIISFLIVQISFRKSITCKTLTFFMNRIGKTT